MREKRTRQGLTVQAIAGTHVVLLGFGMDEADCAGLLGFAIQGFTWSDSSATPAHDYTYRVVALKGSPQALEEAAAVPVRVRTESPAGGRQDIYFNRGAAASQEDARRFRNRPPHHA